MRAVLVHPTPALLAYARRLVADPGAGGLADAAPLVAPADARRRRRAGRRHAGASAALLLALVGRPRRRWRRPAGVAGAASDRRACAAPLPGQHYFVFRRI